ncbi:MAG TPA: DUF2834 domain-containing protein [Solibacterales bacterium]|nr:DUF2834 domain-containing protein [Bryobacterales bacterium]
MAGFGILTGLALREVGYWGIIAPHFRSWGAAQVFVDLVILAVLACLWMGKDASQRRSLPAGPFIALTILAGSFGPLLYLLLRELRRPPAR